MFCEATGEIILHELLLRIPAEVQLTAFLLIPEASAFKHILWNDFSHRYYLDKAEMHGRLVTVKLDFFDQRLREVALSLFVHSNSGRPQIWSVEGEQVRHEAHKLWMRSCFPRKIPDDGGRYWFSWGNACAVLDTRKGGTEIRIDYRAKGQSFT